MAAQPTFRRAYADLAPSPVTKRRGRGFFRWTWRLTYLSAMGGTAWLGYSIYLLRTPQEQFDPDPGKKTLVVLGMLIGGRERDGKETKGEARRRDGGFNGFFIALN